MDDVPIISSSKTVIEYRTRYRTVQYSTVPRCSREYCREIFWRQNFTQLYFYGTVPVHCTRVSCQVCVHNIRL